MMEFKKKINEIEQSSIHLKDKIKKMNSLVLDLTNELEAVDQNMSPEVEHDLAKKLTIANKLLEKLKRREKELNEDHMCDDLIEDKIINDKTHLSPEIEDMKNFCHTKDLKKKHD